MSPNTLPEIWLRGPVAGVPGALQPVAHALLQAREDAARTAADLTPSELWLRPGGAAAAGYHLRHMAGSLDRLFTYARGEPLSEAQRAALHAERESAEPLPDAGALVALVEQTIDAALDQLRHTPPETLSDDRPVGRAKLPSTVLGLLFHGAEHTARHTGQLITTVKIVRGMSPHNLPSREDAE